MLQTKAEISVSSVEELWDARPFGDRLLQSLEYLGFKARSHNAAAACDSISRIVSEKQKYALFRQMFPEEWRRSRASFYRAGHYSKYSERANQLIELINEKCFPLLGFWQDDPEAEFERFAISPLNFDLCCEEIYYEDLRISYAVGLLFYFQEDELWDFFSGKFGVSADDFPEIKKDPHPNVWKKVQTPEVAAYSDLLKLVDHSTGNPWLDSTHCQYAEWYEWNRETIEELTQAYQDATKVFDGLAELDEMIEADPRKVLLELITFWNEGATGNKKPLRRRNSCKRAKALPVSPSH
jgi:hypothetical protein